MRLYARIQGFYQLQRALMMPRHHKQMLKHTVMVGGGFVNQGEPIVKYIYPASLGYPLSVVNKNFTLTVY